MARIRCENGHFYDTDKHRLCPYCGIPDLDMEPTRPKSRDKKPGKENPLMGSTRAQPEFPEEPKIDRKKVTEEKATIGIFHQKKGFDPVVGWLVCIEGPDKGMDYRIRAERNFIGRSLGMDIAIKGDHAISRENHAILSYDPKNKIFKISPGSGRGLVYLNGTMVDSSLQIKASDMIELGQTKLLFVPLCGEHFQWE